MSSVTQTGELTKIQLKTKISANTIPPEEDGTDPILFGKKVWFKSSSDGSLTFNGASINLTADTWTPSAIITSNKLYEPTDLTTTITSLFYIIRDSNITEITSEVDKKELLINGTTASKIFVTGADPKVTLDLGEPLFDHNTENLFIGSIDGATKKMTRFYNANDIDNIISNIDLNQESIILTNKLKGKYATKTVGGIAANTLITATTLHGLLQQILGIQAGFAPTGFSFSISPSTIVADLVGDENTTQTQALNATWSVSNKGTYTDAFDVDINNMDVSTSESQSVSIGSVSYKNADTSITVSGTCRYTGKDGYSSDTLRNSATLTIKRKCYYGDTSDPTYIEITSKSQLCPNNISLNKSKAVFKYPKCWGAISLIKDSNGYDVTDLFARTETTLHGGTYYVYTMKADNTGTFKYSIN